MLNEQPGQSLNSVQHLELEVKTLNEQKHTLLDQCALLSIETEKLNTLLKEKDLEIAALKQMSSNKDQKNQKVPTEAEIRALKILIQDAEKRIVLLLNENKKLTELVKDTEENEKLIQVYGTRVKELELTVTKLQSENRVIKEKEEGEQKTAGDLKENDYEKTIAELSQELNLWKIKYDNLSIKMEEEFRRYKVDTERALKIQSEESLKVGAEAFDNERREYNELIKSFKEKFVDFEKKLLVVMQENERYCAQIICKDKEIENLKRLDFNAIELEELKKRLLELGSKADSERLDSLRKLEEAQEKNEMSKAEISLLNHKIYVKDAEIEKLTKKVMSAKKKAQSYIDKALGEIEQQFKLRLAKEKEEYLAVSSAEKQQTSQQMSSYLGRIQEGEARVSLLLNDNKELSSQIEGKNEEIKALKMRLEDLLKQKENESYQLRVRAEDDKRILLDQEVKKVEAQFKERVELYEGLIKTFTLKIQDFEQRQIMYFIEIERLYMINSNLIDDLNKITRDVKDLAQENTELNNNIAEVNQAFLSTSDEKVKLERLVGELKRKVEDYDKRSQALLSENARLDGLSGSRLKEIEDLKQSLASVMNAQEDLRASKQMESLKQAHNDLREMALMFEREKNNTDNQLMQLKHIIEMNRAEIVRLQGINQQRTVENSQLRSEMEMLGSSAAAVMQLKEEVRLKTQQNEQLRKEIEELRKTKDFFQQQLEQISLKSQESGPERFGY